MMIELSKYELKIDKPGGSDEIDISISNDRDDEILVDLRAVVIDGIMMMFRKDAVDEMGDNADIFFDEMMVAGYKKNRMIFEEMSFDDIESLIFGAMAVFKELQPDEFMRLLIKHRRQKQTK